MSIENRRYVRFLLDIPALKHRTDSQSSPTTIKQVSIGGCLTEWDDSVFPGDEFCLEVQLPNKNYLPLMCKVIYKFENQGVGVKFHDIVQFEQELLSDVITEQLENEGLPMLVDPFTLPPRYVESQSRQSDEKRLRQEQMVEEAIASEK